MMFLFSKRGYPIKYLDYRKQGLLEKPRHELQSWVNAFLFVTRYMRYRLRYCNATGNAKRNCSRKVTQTITQNEILRRK